MIRGVHTMFYSDKPDELRAFLRDKLCFPATDVGGGWLIFDLPEADMGVHRSSRGAVRHRGRTIFRFIATTLKRRLSNGPAAASSSPSRSRTPASGL